MSDSVTDVANDLSVLVRETIPRLQAIGEPESLTRGPGTWLRKEILGHLIDSAVNNHQRFVRTQMSGELSFPDYDGDSWVAVQGYRERHWRALVSLWAELNAHLVHVISRIPPDRLGTPCRIGPSQPVTLEFIVRDYVKHLRHHLEQILDPEAATGRKHPPFA